jgi:hypothetical protein
VGATSERQWIVKHALRSLVKKGHHGALEALGAGAKPAIRIERFRLAQTAVAPGDDLRFSFEILSRSRRSQDLMVDYAVHFMNANGEQRPKVFKLRKIAIAPGARVAFDAKVSFKTMTTRRHYPGRHRIEALVNGVTYPLGEFDLHARSARSRQA